MRKRDLTASICILVVVLVAAVSCGKLNGQKSDNNETKQANVSSAVGGSLIADLRGVELLRALPEPEQYPEGISHLPHNAPGITLDDIRASSVALLDDDQKLPDWWYQDYERLDVNIRGVITVHPFEEYPEDWWANRRYEELGYKDYVQFMEAVVEEFLLATKEVGLERIEGELNPEYDMALMALSNFYFGQELPEDWPFLKTEDIYGSSE